MPDPDNAFWREELFDLLAEDGVRGVVVSVLYEDRRYMIRQINVMKSDVALLGARLLRLATDGDEQDEGG